MKVPPTLFLLACGESLEGGAHHHLLVVNVECFCNMEPFNQHISGGSASSFALNFRCMELYFALSTDIVADYASGQVPGQKSNAKKKTRQC
ncbi:unnamed protein product [Protopolystoma xenopodis]|uniref:Uncharacterized protein n=1 Tax=Protopolystoma xenopodis TaxID=117903 RepID=A0A3S4ZPL8_9PLAT|nr:unnamed protein product [Protopolystoma xenopodis]